MPRMVPPACRAMCRASWVPVWNQVAMLPWMGAMKSAKPICVSGWPCTSPQGMALNIRSTGPTRAAASSRWRSTSAGSLASTVVTSATPPPRCSSACSSYSGPVRRAASTTTAPSRAKARATAPPTAPVAPYTMALRFFNSMVLVSCVAHPPPGDARRDDARPPRKSTRGGHQRRTSKIRLNGVCAACRKCEKPALRKTSARRFGPACAPSTSLPPSEMACAQQMSDEPA